MKNLVSIFILVLLCSCNNEKVIHLPEISSSDTNEVLDVSPAYLFYDESKPDSLELNRKNLIGSTNWLVNVDKRLTLSQAIPSIIFLQEKKRNKKMHKNEEAKNYFSCNNTSIKNLGFIEFTDIHYHFENSTTSNKFGALWGNDKLKVNVKSLTEIQILGIPINSIVVETNLNSLKTELKKLQIKDSTSIILNLKRSLSFQDYISLKSELNDLNLKTISIDINEFIY